MGQAMDIKGQIIQNLEDAGCGEKMIKEFMILGKQRKVREQLRLLAGHKNALLDIIQKNHKRLDCLDYLIYKFNKGDC